MKLYVLHSKNVLKGGLSVCLQLRMEKKLEDDDVRLVFDLFYFESENDTDSKSPIIWR